jgi:hypothetical protein
MHRKNRLVTHGLLLGLALACAAPVMAQSARKVGPESLNTYWILLNTKVDADVPNSGRNLDKPVCAAVTYSIGSDGATMNVEVAKVVPDSDLGAVGKSVVSRFHYGPSLTNKDSAPVSTYYVVSFNLPTDPAQARQITDACKLPGYSS